MKFKIKKLVLFLALTYSVKADDNTKTKTLVNQSSKKTIQVTKTVPQTISGIQTSTQTIPITKTVTPNYPVIPSMTKRMGTTFSSCSTNTQVLTHWATKTIKGQSGELVTTVVDTAKGYTSYIYTELHSAVSTSIYSYKACRTITYGGKTKSLLNKRDGFSTGKTIPTGINTSKSTGKVIPTTTSTGKVIPTSTTSTGKVIPTSTTSTGKVIPTSTTSTGKVIPTSTTSTGEVISTSTDSITTKIPSSSLTTTLVTYKGRWAFEKEILTVPAEVKNVQMTCQYVTNTSEKVTTVDYKPYDIETYDGCKNVYNFYKTHEFSYSGNSVRAVCGVYTNYGTEPKKTLSNNSEASGICVPIVRTDTITFQTLIGTSSKFVSTINSTMHVYAVTDTKSQTSTMEYVTDCDNSCLETSTATSTSTKIPPPVITSTSASATTTTKIPPPISTSSSSVTTSSSSSSTKCLPVYVTVTEKDTVTVTKKETVTVTIGGTKTPISTNESQCAEKWAQCGGVGFSGPTCCKSGSTCHEINKYYSQCY